MFLTAAGTKSKWDGNLEQDRVYDAVRIRPVHCYVQHMAILGSCRVCIPLRHYNGFTNFTFVSI